MRGQLFPAIAVLSIASAALTAFAAPRYAVKFTVAGSIHVADCTASDAKFHWLGDVSGGTPSREGQPGEDGTFVMLSPAALRIFLQ